MKRTSCFPNTNMTDASTARRRGATARRNGPSNGDQRRYAPAHNSALRETRGRPPPPRPTVRLPLWLCYWHDYRMTVTSRDRQVFTRRLKSLKL
ncbi:hypothetical protein EVAR_75625_1 [Eumeta japonica]|uniref:Uncharacterized protein n=1 Tax=Eumeta variegata TaxID=151549 RepID=A0A4C1TZZ1_EUMVA|nr:hypothetical protein EVAR_75625_1 [Eumeta japonica]